MDTMENMETMNELYKGQVKSCVSWDTKFTKRDRKIVMSERKFINWRRSLTRTWIVSLVLISLVTSVVTCRVTDVTGRVRYSSLETVVVEEDETLWTIADGLNGSYDLRKIVKEIREINNLSGATVYPGQRLKVPVF